MTSSLAAEILSAENVAEIAATARGMKDSSLAGRPGVARFTIQQLCASHERLRAELAGAEKVIERMDRKQRHGCTDALCKDCDQ